MFRSIILALTVASASAFMAAPRAAAAPKTVVKAFESELGAQPPLGCWDPLGILENADQDRFDRLREVEIKHGRVSMLAVLGHITTSSGVRLGGNIDFDGDKFADIPTGLAALGAVPPFGLVQIFFFVGFLEVRHEAYFSTPDLNFGYWYIFSSVSFTNSSFCLLFAPIAAFRDERCNWRG